MKVLNSILSVAFVSIMLTACAQTPSGNEVRKEINQMEDQTKHGSVGKQCGEDLEEYIKHVDLVLALSKEKAQKGDSEEIRKKLKESNEKMEALGKRMKEHVHLYTEGDCLAAWTNAQQKYAQYVQENLQDFMPKN